MTSSFPATDGTVVLRSPAALVSSIAGMFGFIPRRSVIMLGRARRADGRIAAAPLLRHDMPAVSGPGAVPLRPVIDHLCGILNSHTDDTGRFDPRLAATVIVVDDRLVATSRALRNVFNYADAALRTGLGQGLWVSEIAAGVDIYAARQHGSPEVAGCCDDPRATETAALSVLQGRAIHERREDLAATLAPLPPHVDPDCTVAVGARGHRVVDDPTAELRWMLDLLLQHDPATVTCAQLHRAETALRDKRIRDGLVIVGLAPDRARVDGWLTLLTRRLRGNGGAQAATLLGWTYYVYGEGVAALTALEVAVGHDPRARLAVHLLEGVQCGMEPVVVRELAEVSLDVATTLGVSLPLGVRGWLSRAA